MIVKFLPTAQSVAGCNLAGQCVVVIDALRATTVITAALQSGARSVIPVATPEAAMQVAQHLAPQECILGGERNADKIPGFHLGNSPQSYDRQTVEGRHVVLTTTNGTLALDNCRRSGADVVFVAALTNYEAVAQRVLAQCDCRNSDLALVASGSEGRFSIEDSLCASLIVRFLQRSISVQFADDLSFAISCLSQSFVDDDGNLLSAHLLLSHGTHFRRLAAKGYDADVSYCLALNSSETVGRMMPDGSICAV